MNRLGELFHALENCNQGIARCEKNFMFDMAKIWEFAKENIEVEIVEESKRVSDSTDEGSIPPSVDV